MIIEYIHIMKERLFTAGYRPPLPKQEPETWIDCVARMKRMVAEYLEEKR